MELRHLRYFVVLAEELHFGRAADRLYITQPGLSQQVSQLEHELGVRLFHRSTRQVQLTSAGKVFLEEALRTVRQADRAVAVAERASRGEIGEVQFGFIKQSANALFGKFLHEYKSQNPDLSVRAELFSTTPAIEGALLRNAIDMGLGLGPIASERLASRVVHREELLVVLPESHPLAKLDRVAMGCLAEESWNLWQRETMNPLLYEHIASFFREAGFLPDVRYESGEAEAVYLWAASGIAISLVPADTLSAVSQPGVVVRPLVYPTPSWDHVLVWRRDDESPALRRLLELEVMMNCPGLKLPSLR